MSYDYDKSDPTFVADLQASKASVERVARWLSGRGYPVFIRPVFVRPSVEQMGDYSDDGDLEVLVKVEVKQRQSLTFTGKDDFPYPTLIVDRCRHYDEARPKPYAYVILNREMTAAFVVNVPGTVNDWKRVLKHDRFKDREREFYECPIELIQVVTIP